MTTITASDSLTLPTSARSIGATLLVGRKSSKSSMPLVRRRMANLDPKNIDPRFIARAAQQFVPGQLVPGQIIPGRGPISMPVAMPGPGGPGGMYNRYREMTLEEMLLENR